MKYLTVDELRAIADLAELLNTRLGKLSVSLGNADVIDEGTESVGQIGITDAGVYGLIIDNTPKDDL